jgi:hypothetical protein
VAARSLKSGGCSLRRVRFVWCRLYAFSVTSCMPLTPKLHLILSSWHSTSRNNVFHRDSTMGVAFEATHGHKIRFIPCRREFRNYFTHSQALIVQDGPLASPFWGVSWSHTYRHTVGFLWASDDQPVAREFRNIPINSGLQWSQTRG